MTNRTVLTITAALALTIGLAACGDGTNGRSAPIPRDSNEYARPTTTYTPPTTAAADEADIAYDYLMGEVPEWRVNDRSDVEDLLDLICQQLDDSNGDFSTVGEAIVAGSSDTYDLTYSQAGAVLAAAVVISCPEWQDAGLEWADN